MKKCLHESASTACEGCEYFSEGTCESPTLCVYRRIEGTTCTVKDVLQDIMTRYVIDTENNTLTLYSNCGEILKVYNLI